MRCASCGAMFKPSKSSQTKCERCEKREREQRAAAKHAGITQARTVATTPQPIKISGPGASMLGAATPAIQQDTTRSAPPVEPLVFGEAARREEERRRQQEARDAERRRIQAERAQAAQTTHTHARPDKGPDKGEERAQSHPPKSARPQQAPKQPRVPRTSKPIPPRVEITDDLRATIEARYLELAKPVEFDGIRTQIAAEFGIPKSVVKKTISELRARMALPSWWDLQAYTGAEADLERIRIAYVPLLPVPEVGVHKALAAQLGMDPRAVYQGIRRIRAEMRLPQYNPPAAHGDADPAAGGAAPTAALTQAASQPTDARA